MSHAIWAFNESLAGLPVMLGLLVVLVMLVVLYSIYLDVVDVELRMSWRSHMCDVYCPCLEDCVGVYIEH